MQNPLSYTLEVHFAWWAKPLLLVVRAVLTACGFLGIPISDHTASAVADRLGTALAAGAKTKIVAGR